MPFNLFLVFIEDIFESSSLKEIRDLLPIVQSHIMSKKEKVFKEINA